MTQTIIHSKDMADSVGESRRSGSVLNRLSGLISGFCTVLAGFSLVAIVLLTTAEVFSRTVLKQPLGWNVALVEQYFMMAMAFFGTVAAYRAGAHIAVATFHDRLPPAGRTAAALLAHLLVLAGFVLLTWAGVVTTSFSFITGEAPVPGMAELPLPTWWWKSIMPVAGVLGVIVVLCEMFQLPFGASAETSGQEADRGVSEGN